MLIAVSRIVARKHSCSIGIESLPYSACDRQRDDHAERGALGHRRPAGVDAAHDDARTRRAAPGDGRGGRAARAAAPPAPSAPIRPGRDERDQHDRRHEQQRHDQARDDAGRIEPARRGVGHRAVDEECDARRDQVAETRAGSDRAEHQPLVVLAVAEGGQRDRGDRSGRRDRRARHRREQRRGADVGVQQTARQRIEPVGERAVHLVGRAAAHQDLAEQDVERDREQHVVLGRPPRAGRRTAYTAGMPEIHRGAEHRGDEHRGGDVQPEEHQPEHHGEADDDLGGADHGRRSVAGPSSTTPAVSLSISSSSVCGP